MASNEAVVRVDATASKGMSGGRPIDRVASDLSSPDEREATHLHGSIQPHGALLAVLERSSVITHASANLFEILGLHAIDVLGQTLDAAIGETARAALLRPATDEERLPRVHMLVGPTGESVYLHAHRTGPYLCIDIEPNPLDVGLELPTLRAQSLLHSFEHVGGCTALCELAVRGVKDITGYDRVMACRFGERGHGEVIAEAIEPHLVPFLGLRYPVSDVAIEARRQVLRQRVSAIADANDEPVPLLVDPSLDEVVPLDLARCCLRSVSPAHRDYLRNLQAAASLTVGLVRDGKPWGMLVCHHERPRIAGPEIRAAAGMIGEVVSLLLAHGEAGELRAQRSSRNAILADLSRHLSADVPLPEAFAAAEAALLGLVDATGAVVEIGGTRIHLGRTPPLPATDIALEGLRIIAANNLVALDDVPLRFPEIEACRVDGSGALFLPLESGDNDAILWFRPELSRTVQWGGNPTRDLAANAPDGRLSPPSFPAWQQVVGGHSIPWSHADRAMALECRDTIRAAIARRTRAALRESEDRFQLLAEHSGVVVTVNDLGGVWQYVSPAAEHVLGWRPQELIGREIMELIHPDDRALVRDVRAALVAGADGQSICYRYLRPDGSALWVEGHARFRAVTDGAGEFVVVLRDATERKAVEARLTEALGRLERVASIDGLTSIANRRHFDEMVEREWRRCGRDRLPLSLLLLDADHFKRFNDCYGHLAGDACLQAIAAQIESMAQRPGDLAARYGGEEFLLLLPNTGVEGASRVAERVRALVEGLRIPHETNGGNVVTVSVGVATVWPGDADAASHDIELLLARTDAALYRAKSEGRNRVVVSPADEVGLAVVDFGTRTRDEADAVDPDVAESPQARDIAATHEALVQFLYRAPIGLVQTTLDGTIEMINPMSASLLMPISEDGDLDNLFVALEAVVPDLRHRVERFEAANGTVCEGVRIPLPVGATLGTATQVLSISLSKLDATRLMAMVGDVTLEVQREQSGLALRLDAAARTDNLTKLPNRTVVCDLIEGAIARRRAEPSRDFAVLFMNCDRFKQINDTLGYAAGDAVLGLMADRLQSTLREVNRGVGKAADKAMVGRLGGDEFAVLLEELRSPDEMHAIAQRLLHVLSQPYHVQGRQLHFSVSMGVVRGAQATADAATVLQDSSIAMVEAKRAGGARYVLFESAMHERALHRGRIESELRRALFEHQLFVVYQPVVALQAGDSASALPARSAGVEALVRWRHPTRGEVQPTEFIAVAEESGLIGPLGEFVLATACRQFVGWQTTLGALAPRLLAVNLSRGQLIESGFVEFVAQVLRTTGMPPEQLQLEVTESLAAQDESIQARLHELKALGLTLALDDFGTGYSSLASLHELPVDTVKIDRSFVSEAATSTYHRVLIEATIRVASSLDMATVAEGIETDEQALLLRELHCGKGQGYLFSKPLTADDLVSWLRQTPDPFDPALSPRAA